jgi:pyridoxal phosphate enzyme (YggS family)
VEALTLESLQHNLARVRERIHRSAERAGRDSSLVDLVAVTKGFPPEAVRLAAQAGLSRVGENRVEEALHKQAVLAVQPGLEWHLVGHLQSRKVGQVPGAFQLVHSVDRLKIARLLDQRCAVAGLRQPVLLQCNVSGEASKSGWPLADPSSWEAALADFKAVAEMPHLHVLGLMTMAPLSEDPEVARPSFRRLRTLAEFLRDRIPGAWAVLSMGMSDDFETAVEEGATLLRIGRALFGERPPE